VRRLQYTGRSTYIVSLPKSWVVAQGLRQGSAILVEELGDKLLIRPLRGADELKRRSIVINIDTSMSLEAVARRIIGSYVMGYDQVIVKSSSRIEPGLRNTIRELIVSKLLGVEVVYEDEHEVRLQALLSPSTIPLVDVLKRLSRVVNSVLEDSCLILSRTGPPPDEVIKEDDSVDRVYFYAIRVINLAAEGYAELRELHSAKKLLVFRAFSKLLERIGDHSVNIARYAHQIIDNEALYRKTHELCMKSLETYTKAVDSFFNRDPDGVEEVAFLTKKLVDDEEKFISQVAGSLEAKSLIALRVVLESIRRISEYSRDIAELALDLSLESREETTKS
jgi:phosphate uptake regulator